jgi:uncharacterized protein involved in exopolysaccharide biosynthesis
MADSLDLVDVLNRLRGRWRVWVTAALTGASIGAGAAALRPVRYVAETHILIELPADSIGVFPMLSPSYLDSLRTYATLAESATVRTRALEALSDGHRTAAREIDADLPAHNRVLVIRAAARDADSALAFARATAEQTVRMVEATQGHERLALIDPGVPPNTPEDRRILVTALAAAFFSLLAATLYETIRFLAATHG